MALVTTVAHKEGGDQALYNIPDAELAKYKVEVQAATSSTKSKDQADAVLPSAVGGGDVQAYGQDICFIYNRYTGEIYDAWYC